MKRLRLPIRLVNEALIELGAKSQDERAFLRVKASAIESYREAGYDEDEDLIRTHIGLQNGETYIVDMPIEKFEKLLTNEEN